MKKQKIIFHIDGDAFFASCEQSTNLPLRGQPIAIGRERGIATAFSYEAKALGVQRGLSNAEIIKAFPSVRLVESDYRKYSIFSKRMINIVRQYTSVVEAASIDECYADFTGIVSNFSEAEALARELQDVVCTKLGLTVSIGIGATKSIAKIGSGLQKPRGLTVITPENISELLYPLSVGRVSGIGGRTALRLQGLGVRTIGDLVEKPASWVRETCDKHIVELHQELNGTDIWEVETVSELPKSVSKIRAFRPATNKSAYLLSELSRNCELVCEKLRRLKLGTKHVQFGMKRISDAYKTVSEDIVLPAPTNDPGVLFSYIEKYFEVLYKKDQKYRATFVGAYGLSPIHQQYDLFAVVEQEVERDKLYGVMDTLSKRFGGHPIVRASSLSAFGRSSKDAPLTDTHFLNGTPLLTTPYSKQVLDIPYLGEVA